MKTARWIVAGLMLIGLVAVSRVVSVAAPGQGAQQASPRIQYAETEFALAKLQLQVVMIRNEQAPGTFPLAVVLARKQHLALAEVWLKQAQAKEQGQPFNAALAAAEIMHQGAQVEYENALRISKASAMSPQALERMRLNVELTRLRVENAKALDLSSPTAQLEFEFDRLREAVADQALNAAQIKDMN
jgi:hypothetical protein